jgi:SAM-dependent methyltransferase
MAVTAHMADPTAEARRASLVARLFGMILGTVEVHSLYIGDRLGFYRALADGACSPAEVAATTGTHERYVREWLEQQAVAGVLDVEDAGAGANARRYRLPAGHDEVLLDRASLDCLAPFARMVVGMVRAAPHVVSAFRTGGGVSYGVYDADFCEGQGDMNGAMFDALLTRDWLPAIPGLHARLLAAPPARVADVACGTGRSTLAIARAYPRVQVDGIDIDAHSIGIARGNLAVEPDLAGRVRFHLGDGADSGLAGRYDLITIFEAVHDLSDPVGVLAATRGLLARGGSVLVADERVAEEFSPPGDEVERLMYAYSVLHCLPVGMADQPSVATGTVMRPAKLREYARAAGFTEVEVLPITNDFWRFYHLHP